MQPFFIDIEHNACYYIHTNRCSSEIITNNMQFTAVENRSKKISGGGEGTIAPI